MRKKILYIQYTESRGVEAVSCTQAYFFARMHYSFPFRRTAISERKPEIVVIRPVKSAPEGEVEGGDLLRMLKKQFRLTHENMEK